MRRSKKAALFDRLIRGDVCNGQYLCSFARHYVA
jgi:hypothetical protein